MNLPDAKDILLYYAAFLTLALIVVFRRRPRQFMRLRLRSTRPDAAAVTTASKAATTKRQPLPTPLPIGPQSLHVKSNEDGERPLNVVFNYNGHSWDAYEVLGLPAGSSPEKVEQSFRLALDSVEPESQPFLRAAYQAIHEQWTSFRKTGEI